MMYLKFSTAARHALLAVLLAALFFALTVFQVDAGAAQVNATPDILVPPTRTPLPVVQFTGGVTPTAAPQGSPLLSGVNAYAPTPPTLLTPLPVTGRPSRPPLTAEDWREWPVLPAGLSEEMRQLYRDGLAKGTNPRAFSIIGDCQSQPEVFMAVFDTHPWTVSLLPPDLRQTVNNFSGSFARTSPTIRDGITAGAVLWTEWANNFGRGQVCQAGETPLTCELRLNNPSIVFIHIGTHWEARNHRYLTLIVETIKEHGAVPVMVTKADNREGDERINEESVRVAVEQGIPVWNFWASVQDTPNQGLVYQSNMYLNEEATEIHRFSALQVLDIIWRSTQ